MRVTIEKVVAQGDGLARVGKDICFVPGTLAGEVVEVREVSRRKQVVRCELEEVISASVHRVTPLCPYYSRCGGCDLQIVSPEEGVKIKEAIVLENLRRLGKVDFSRVTVDPPITSAPLSYRQRVRFQVDLKKERIGFFAAKSHEVIDIASCPVLVPELNELLNSGRDEILTVASRKRGRDGIVTVPALCGSDGRVSLSAEPVSVSVSGKPLQASAEVFFQNNVGVLEKMIPFIQQYTVGERIVDLFSGVGTFASFVESEQKETVAVERESACLALARENLHYTRFFTGEVESWGKKEHAGEVDTVIVDPPRSGLSASARRAIHQMRPHAIIYVSCDSATFSRDTAMLFQNGYALERIAFADMYPQTSHTETIALLRRIS